MRIWLAGLLLAPLIASCADDPKTISSNPQNVAIRFESQDDLDKRVPGQAAAKCAEYGKIPILQNVSQVGTAGVANFDCVEAGGPTRRLSNTGSAPTR